jgi:ABC-type transport system involved in multi-copper enzyme maturation permease subunit
MATILTLASGTFGEAMRRKILNVFLFVAIAMIILFFAFASFSPSTDMTITLATGLGIISLAGVFISVILGINLIPNEIEKRTIYTILSKPVKRHEFLVGKFLGGLATVFVNILLMGALFTLGVILFKDPHHHLHLDILQGVLMIFFQMMLVNALAVMFSVFTSPFVNFFLTFAVYILGSMSAITESLGEESSNGKRSAIVQWIFKAVHFLVPNFANFNVQNPIIHPEVVIQSMGKYMATNILYAIIYSTIMLLIAILIFDRREV